MAGATFGPWTLTQSEQARLENYNALDVMVTARGVDTRDELYQRDLREAGSTFIVLSQRYVNVASLVARAGADLLLPRAPLVKSADTKVQERVAAIARRSKLHWLAWRTAFWTSAHGDSFLSVSDVQQVKGDDRSRAPVISLRRAVNSVARSIRPEDPPFRRAFLFRSKVGDLDLYLEATAGFSKWFAFRGTEALPELPAGYTPSVETKENVPLMVHIAAPRGDSTDEGFGEADSAGTEDHTFEIANRLRQVMKILDRHAEPAMNVPDGSIDDAGKMDPRKAKVHERGVDGLGAEYIVWQSQLGEAYTEIDKLFDLIALLTETPTALWGRDKNGNVESGRALKFRLLAGLGKARRMGGALKEGLADAFRLALRREDILGGRTPGEYELTVDLWETFIADEQETTDKVAKLRQAGVMSVRAGVEESQGLAGADLDAEIQAIEDEAGQAPVGFGGGIASQNAPGA